MICCSGLRIFGERKMPEISIIVPVYNVEQYLDRCVNSILNQTFTDFELILVDDGSPDHCPKMCDEWSKKDARIRVLHKTNGGLSSARNAGLEIAVGDYVGFVDSDDWIAPDMYETLYRLLKQYQADISCGGIERTDVMQIKETQTGHVMVYSKEEYAKKYFKIGSNETVHYVWNKLYNRKTADNIKFPEGLINEDVEGFFLALSVSEKIVETDQTVYYYWKNQKGISYQWFTKKQMDLLKNWQHVYEICLSDHKDWVQYSRLNFYRAHLGLLCRIMLSGEDNKYDEEKEYLLTKLKTYYRCLMKSQMPFSRKIIMTAMCVNYRLTADVVHLMAKRDNFR